VETYATNTKLVQGQGCVLLNYSCYASYSLPSYSGEGRDKICKYSVSAQRTKTGAFL